MTDKPTPTDAELKAMWQIHAADIGASFAMPAQSWQSGGQPAQAAEPMALLVRKNSWREGQWEAAPPNSPSYGREWASQRVYVYTTPQPTHAQAGAVPLTPERVKEIVRGAGYDQCGIPDTERAAFINGLRHGEREHGIKGGQHVS